MTKTQWLNLYCSWSGEKPEEVLRNYDVVPCHDDCDDIHCKGWRLERKPMKDADSP